MPENAKERTFYARGERKSIYWCYSVYGRDDYIQHMVHWDGQSLIEQLAIRQVWVGAGEADRKFFRAFW